jgi:uncharacterized YccA/Bax inhibitor family protein
MSESKSPLLDQKRFDTLAAQADASVAFTAKGTIAKCALMLVVAMLTAATAWTQLDRGRSDLALPLAIGGAIVAFICAWVGAVSVRHVVWAAPVYALAEGFVLGAVSWIYESKQPGIVVQAVIATFRDPRHHALPLPNGRPARYRGSARSSRSPRCRSASSTSATCFSACSTSEAGRWSAARTSLDLTIGGIIIVIAALNLILDFDFIDRAESSGAPERLEWTARSASWSPRCGSTSRS